jgi:hypothetical protein
MTYIARCSGDSVFLEKHLNYFIFDCDSYLCVLCLNGNLETIPTGGKTEKILRSNIVEKL